MLSTRWILERFRPELMVCCHSIPSGLIALHTLKRHRIPFLTLLRGQDVPGYPEPSRWMHTLAWPVNRYIWRKSHRLIANSKGLADLAHESAPGLRIDVVNNGVNMELYRPPREPRTAGTRPVRVVYVAEFEGRAVGTATLYLVPGSSDGFINGLAVLPQYQGRGFGRQILSDAVDGLISRGRESVKIEVQTDNEGALGLYESAGFEKSVTYAYYRVDAGEV